MLGTIGGQCPGGAARCPCSGAVHRTEGHAGKPGPSSAILPLSSCTETSGTRLIQYVVSQNTSGDSRKASLRQFCAPNVHSENICKTVLDTRSRQVATRPDNSILSLRCVRFATRYTWRQWLVHLCCQVSSRRTALYTGHGRARTARKCCELSVNGAELRGGVKKDRIRPMRMRSFPGQLQLRPFFLNGGVLAAPAAACSSQSLQWRGSRAATTDRAMCGRP